MPALILNFTSLNCLKPLNVINDGGEGKTEGKSKKNSHSHLIGGEEGGGEHQGGRVLGIERRENVREDERGAGHVPCV